jgi:hypothetical protein
MRKCDELARTWLQARKEVNDARECTGVVGGIGILDGTNGTTRANRLLSFLEVYSSTIEY